MKKQNSLLYRAFRHVVHRVEQSTWETTVNNPRFSKPILEALTPLYTRLDPRFNKANLHRRDDCLWQLNIGNKSYLLPDIANNASSRKEGTVSKILKYGFDADPMVTRYEDENVKIEPGDVVVDVGGYIGMFAAYANSSGSSHVYSIEPTPKSYYCLEFNTADIETIHPFNIGIWSENGTKALERSSDPTDNRLRNHGSTEVKVVTIETFSDEQDIDTIDFLKVDVEGLEMHVLKGIGEARVRKIGVDAGEGSDSNPHEVANFLKQRGFYTWRHNEHDHLVYGTIQ